MIVFKKGGGGIAIVISTKVFLLRTGNVVNDDGYGRVANIARDQTAETLLPGRVPQLQPHCSVFQVHCF